MRPEKPRTTRSSDLFLARLDQIINLRHELAQLAGQIDWDSIDAAYREGARNWPSQTKSTTAVGLSGRLSQRVQPMPPIGPA